MSGVFGIVLMCSVGDVMTTHHHSYMAAKIETHSYVQLFMHVLHTCPCQWQTLYCIGRGRSHAIFAKSAGISSCLTFGFTVKYDVERCLLLLRRQASLGLGLHMYKHCPQATLLPLHNKLTSRACALRQNLHQKSFGINSSYIVGPYIVPTH